MVKVAGGLWDVGKNATQATEARIHAREYRAADGGLVTTEVVRVRIGKSGLIEFNVSPGPAVMHLVGAGRGVSEEIPLLVPGRDSSLEGCVRAAGDADEYSRRELEEWVWEVREAYPQFQAVGDQTVKAASRASQSEQNAAGSEQRAKQSADAAKTSEVNAGAALSGARSAEQGAKTAETNARAQAGAAASSASAAKQDAERVATIAGSTRWVGTQVEVNGKRSPDLRGPQGPPGADGTVAFEELTPAQRESLRGAPGTTSWAGITGKPSTFAPSSHSHSVRDVTDLMVAINGKTQPTVANDGNIAVGHSASASGDGAAAVGRDASASGWSATAVGQSAKATTDFAQALTAYSKATKNRHTVIGIDASDENIPEVHGTVVVGKPGAPVYLAGRNILTEVDELRRDSGWRRIDGNAVTLSDMGVSGFQPGGGLLIRRVGKQVTLRLRGANVNSTQKRDNVGYVPYGFRSSTGSSDNILAPVYMDGMLGDQGQIGVREGRKFQFWFRTTGDHRNASLTWVTDDSWPTTLPGTPA